MQSPTSYLKRAFRTILQNLDGTEQMIIPAGMAEDTLTLDAKNWVNSPTRIYCPASSTQTVVTAGTGYLLAHVHLVSDIPVIWRIAEKTGGGEVDIEGDVFIASSGVVTSGVNILTITAVNASITTQANIWAHVVIKAP